MIRMPSGRIRSVPQPQNRCGPLPDHAPQVAHRVMEQNPSSIIFCDTFGQGAVSIVSRELITALKQNGRRVILAAAQRVLQRLQTGLAGVQPREIRLSAAPFSPHWWAEKASLRLRGYEVSGERMRRILDTRRNTAGGENCPVVVNYPQILPPPRKVMPQSAVLIYDTAWLDFPGNFQDPDLINRRCKGWLSAVDQVLAISEFTRGEIIRHYGLPPDRVTAAQLAIPTDVQPDANPKSFEHILTDYELEPGKYYFCPSVLRTHKGHNVLASALATTTNRLPVVMCGESTAATSLPADVPWKSYVESLQSQLAALARKGRLRRLGTIDRGSFLALAAMSRAFILPSLYEGFGLPLTEAIGLGKPAICSDIPPFREILTTYAGRARYRLSESGNAESLAQALDEDHADNPWQIDSPTTTNSWSWTDTARIVWNTVSRPKQLPNAKA